MNVIKPADPFPPIEFTMMSGETERLSDNNGRWTVLIVYRGDHCPRCKTYIARLHELADGYAEREVDLRLASMDPEHIARRTIDENGWNLPVAHSLSVEQCQTLALYLTDHEPGAELTGPYAEPGLYLINPEGLTQVIATSNSPSVRPDLDVVLDGIIGTQDRNLPIRGLHTPT
ncbi:MAG: peroxiredoxin family protein [Granulosicoccus sp.]